MESKPKIFSWKSRFSTVLMSVVLILGCILGYTYFVNDGFDKLNITKFPILQNMEQWQITFDTPSGQNAATPKSDADWQPYVQVQKSEKARHNQDEYWIRATLPAEVNKLRDAELFVLGLMSYEVFVDGTKISSENVNPSNLRLNPEFSINMIPLPEKSAGKVLQLRILPNHPGVDTGIKRIAEGKDRLLQIIRLDTLKLVLTVCFFFMAIISLGAFILYNRDTLYFYFALLSLAAGIPCLLLTSFIQFYGSWGQLTYYYGICIPVGTIAVIAIFERLTEPERHPEYRISRYILGVFVAVCFLTAYYSPALFAKFAYIYLLIILVVIPMLALPMVRRYRQRRDGEAAWLAMGVSAILLAFSADYTFHFFPSLAFRLRDIAPYLVYYWLSEFGLLGVFLFVLSLGMVLITRLRSVFVQNQAISASLLESNQRLKALDRLKDDFLANTSHELRTPLQGIIGLTESLLDGVGGPLEPKVQYNLELVVSSGRRLSHLINDLLDLSKLDHQDIQLELAAQPINEAVSLVLAAFDPLAAAKGIQLSNEVSSELPAALADANRLQQILYNLIGNALKFTDHGRIYITAKSADNRLEISVHDTGIGISAAKLASIKEPFEKVHIGSNRGGAGLGLAISQRLIQLHGGELHIQSVEGQGTIASFTLPIIDNGLVQTISNFNKEPLLVSSALLQVNSVEDTHENAAVEDPNDWRIPVWSTELPTATLLIVDDEPINLQVIENFLSGYPIRLLKAATGQEALALLADNQPDLVLLDVLLPDINGYEICRQIRRSWDESALPVILLTAKGRLSDLLEGFDAGANDYIVKPFAKYELLARINIQLKLSRFTLGLEHMVQERTADLEQTTQRLQESVRETAATLSELSVQEERNRISQEIHDQVGHTLTTSIVQLEAARMLLERGDQRGLEKLGLSQKLVRKGLDDIRESVRMMKQQGADFKLESAMILLMNQTMEATGIIIDYSFTPLPQLTSMHKKALYHALQEGLTNGIRHGHSTRFRFQLAYTDNKLSFTLWNNGLSYKPSELGFGLETMQERVIQLGGTLQLKTASAEGDGCLLWIELPIG